MLNVNRRGPPRQPTNVGVDAGAFAKVRGRRTRAKGLPAPVTEIPAANVDEAVAYYANTLFTGGYRKHPPADRSSLSSDSEV